MALKIKFNKPNRCFRPHGGLDMGLRIHCPFRVVDEHSLRRQHMLAWTQISLSIGLISWSWKIDLQYNFRYE